MKKFCSVLWLLPVLSLLLVLLSGCTVTVTDNTTTEAATEATTEVTTEVATGVETKSGNEATTKAETEAATEADAEEVTEAPVVERSGRLLFALTSSYSFYQVVGYEGNLSRMDGRALCAVGEQDLFRDLRTKAGMA